MRYMFWAVTKCLQQLPVLKEIQTRRGILAAVFVLLLASTTIAATPQVPLDEEDVFDYSELCFAGANEIDIANLVNSTQPACATCQNRCGLASIFYFGEVCSCDRLCTVYKDCCPDFKEQCPGEENQTQQLPSTAGTRTTCEQFGKTRGIRHYLLIGSCVTDEAACLASSDDPSTYIPAYDANTGIHYITYKCALCNGVKHPKPWDMQITCNSDQLPFQRANLSETMSDEEFKLAWAWALNGTYGCEMDRMPGWVVQQPRDCIYTAVNERRCNADICPNPDIQKACMDGNLNYVAGTGFDMAYANSMCAVCETGTYIPTDQACQISAPGAIKPPPVFGTFSFRLLFDFDVREPAASLPGSAVQCPPGHVWVQEEKACRKEICNRRNCSNIEILVRVVMTPSFNVTSENVFLIQEEVRIYLSLNYYNFQNVTFIPETDVIRTTLTGKVKFYETENATVSVDHLQQELHNYLNKSVPGIILEVKAERRHMLDQLRKMNCSILQYTSSDYKLENDTMIILSTGRTVDRGRYVIADNTTAYVCSQIYESSPSWTASAAEGILTIILTSLSILALSVRLSLHFFVHFSDKVSAGLQLCLVVALLLAMVSFLLHPLVISNRVVCYIVAVAIHGTFLAAFSWMTVIAFDIMRMLVASKNLQRISSRRISVIIYSLFGVGVPAVIVAVTVGIDFSDIHMSWKPHYGTVLCWISNRYGLLLYFAGPSAVLLTLNVSFFIVSVIILYRSRSNTKKTTSSSKDRLFLHVKLMVLMGITWTIGFLAVPLRTDVLWYLFIILNAAQGVFLLLTFLCASKVRASLCKKTTSKLHRGTQVSSGTGSTSV